MLRVGLNIDYEEVFFAIWKSRVPPSMNNLQKDNFFKEYDFNLVGTRDFHIAHNHSTLPFHLKAISISHLNT